MPENKSANANESEVVSPESKEVEKAPKTDEKKESPIHKYLTALIPTVITAIVLIWVAKVGVGNIQTQLEASREQAKIEAKDKINHELWKIKYDAYREALDLVMKRFYSSSMTDGTIAHTFRGQAPTPEEFGRIYAKLRLLTQNEKLIEAFNRCFGAEGLEKGSPRNVPITPASFDTLVEIMRQDIGTAPDPTPEKDFIMIDFNAKLPTKKQTDKGRR